MQFDVADVKPSVFSLITVTLMAVIGIVLLKWLNAKYPVPGLTDVINSV